jgi:hypothetical protein
MPTKRKTAPARAALQTRRSNYSSQRINYQAIKSVALSALPAILERWLPDGKIVGNEWIACNPRRADQKPGSFKINIRSGKWADFATGDKGGDIISLAAYLGNLRQSEAARNLAQMLGVHHG